MDPSSILDLDLTSPVYRSIDEKYSEILQLSDGFARYSLTQPMISIVIPAYNEAKRLPVTLKKITQFFNRYQMPVEVLCVVEKSQDNTLRLSRQVVDGDPRFQVIDNMVQRGKGYAVRTGMLRAKGEIVFYTDADLSTPIYEVINFLDFLLRNPGIEILIGNRRKTSDHVPKGQKFPRKAAGLIFAQLVKQLTGIDVEDSQAGFKAFRSSANKEIFSKASIDGFAFDVEVLLLAKRLHYQVHSVPIDWINDANSKVNLIIDSFRTIKDIAFVKKRVDESLVALKN
jgi:dolichyl-phosphate beta-glucosyltransferase